MERSSSPGSPGPPSEAWCSSATSGTNACLRAPFAARASSTRRATPTKWPAWKSAVRAHPVRHPLTGAQSGARKVGRGNGSTVAEANGVNSSGGNYAQRSVAGGPAGRAGGWRGGGSVGGSAAQSDLHGWSRTAAGYAGAGLGHGEDGGAGDGPVPGTVRRRDASRRKMDRAAEAPQGGPAVG